MNHRLNKVIINMEKDGLKNIIVSAPHSVYYLTGRMIHPGERMLALLVSADGTMRLFANRLFAQATSSEFALTEFDDIDDPVKCLSEYLPDGELGIDKFWASQFTIRLMEMRAGIKPRLGSNPVDMARIIKDADEIAKMRAASLMNDKATKATINQLKTGITENDVCAMYTANGKSLGAQGNSFEPLICFGKGCAEPHHSSDDTVLKQGDSVIIDVGVAFDGYMADMTRTVFMGKADDEFKRVYDLVKKANTAGRAAARAGIPMKEIDFAARNVIEQGGYGKYFIHRTGHGIGLEVHEPTDVSSTNEFIAQKGMCFSIEPGIYLPGRFGVRIEDLVCVTENGAETLNHLDRELIEI